VTEPESAASASAALRPTGRGRSALLKAAITVAVLTALFAFLPRDTLVGALRQMSLPLFAAALFGLLIGHVVASQKWRLLLRACGAQCTRIEALQAHGAGLFANLCLPSLVGGDVVRAAFISTGARSLPPIAVGSLGDRVIDTAGLLLLAGAGAAIAPGALPGPTLPVLATGGALFALGMGFGPRIIRALRPEWVPARARGLLTQLQAAVAGLQAHPGSTLLAAALSVAIQAGFVVLNAVLGSAVGIEVPLSVWFVAWPLAKLIALAPVSLGGLGVREAALAGLLAGFGVEPALAVAESLLWEAALISLGLVAGAAAFGSRRFTHRTLAEEAE
jgi:uncharacterized membrane protein YbhN (UPF0104 family)